MSPAVRNEIEHWLFLETWDGFLPWRSEKHTHVKLFSDASRFAWGGALSPNAMALVHSWNQQGSCSQSLSGTSKKLFNTVTKLNIDLRLTFVPSSQNQGDFSLQHLSLQDAKLCPSLWMVVQELYCDENGHSVDLMACPSNAQSDLSGAQVPFFFKNPLPGSLGVNVFAVT